METHSGRAIFLGCLALIAVIWLCRSRQSHKSMGSASQRVLACHDAPLGLERSKSGLHIHPVRLDQVGSPNRVAVVPIKPLTDDLEDFLLELRETLDENQIGQRPIEYVFSSNTSLAYPLCEGQWLEFGVAGGATTTWMAKYREAVCGSYHGGSTGVVGFDTFTGLPEDWGPFKQGHFNQKGNMPNVPRNARLVKGLFNESLPPFLSELDSSGGDKPPIYQNVTYLHIDCDLYAGARDALSLLSDRIHPGAVLIFDDLLHYPTYREHEVLALWQWLHASQRRLQIIGIYGPLSERANAVELNPPRDLGYFRQSVAFVVL